MEGTVLLDYGYFSKAKAYTLYGVAMASSTLSIGGSAVIVWLIWKRQTPTATARGELQQAKGNCLASIFTSSPDLYHRLLFGLSTIDILVSTSMLLGPFLSRSDIGLPWAMGNVQTCAVNAFFFQFFIGTAMYNAFLAVYFLLTVRYNFTEHRASKVLEPYLHLLAFGVPLAFGALGVGMELFNPSLLLGICTFAHFPADCQYNDQVECVRGRHEDKVSWAHVVLLLVSAMVGFGCTWFVYWTSLLVNYMLFPLQGFLNMIVYIRPRCLRWKDAYPDRTWVWVLSQVLQVKPAPTTPRTRHLVNAGNINADTGGGGSGTTSNGTGQTSFVPRAHLDETTGEDDSRQQEQQCYAVVAERPDPDTDAGDTT